MKENTSNREHADSEFALSLVAIMLQPQIVRLQLQVRYTLMTARSASGQSCSLQDT